MIERAALIDCVRLALSAHPAVDAAWQGGSAAFDAVDQFSDVDVIAVIADDAADRVFADVEEALSALSPVALRYLVPDTHGFRQTFFRLRDAAEFLVLDLALIRRSDPLLMREIEVHGQGVTWFDRRGILVEEHVDAAENLDQARARIPVLRDYFAMFQHVPTKERLRGRALEALFFYHSMTIRPLTEAYRLLHCPLRRIYSVRYIGRDLPAAAVSELTRLSYPRDLAHLGELHREACASFARVMTLLEAHGPGASRAD